MKKHNIFIVAGTLAAGLSLTGCSDVLDETTRENLTPEYFKTEKGVEGGITALYANLRNVWGNGYWLIANETGTDEYTWGHGGNENDKPIDMSNNGELNPTNCRADVLWNYAFSDINTANGVIENATSVAGIPESLISEARFFRAFDYFWLVQEFGGVPFGPWQWRAEVQHHGCSHLKAQHRAGGLHQGHLPRPGFTAIENLA